MDYLTYLIKHSELVTKVYEPRLPGITKETWFRERMNAKEELENFEEKYPEFTKKFKNTKNLP